jgi:hypothetical protein
MQAEYSCGEWGLTFEKRIAGRICPMIFIQKSFERKESTLNILMQFIFARH